MFGCCVTKAGYKYNLNMERITPIQLSNTHVELVPLGIEHADGLARIGSNPEIWKFLSGEPFRDRQQAEKWIESMLARSEYDLPFVVHDRSTGEIAGTTSYIGANYSHESVEIGYTWYGREFQRTGVNTASKLALLSHAFDSLCVTRVQLQTDARNEASRRAIARIGGKEEGLLRKHKRYPNGFVRDTVVFSIISDEWPVVRERLKAMLV